MSNNLPDYINDITKNLFLDAETNLSKKLLEYSTSVRDSLIMNDMNIHEKSLITPAIHHGYINCLFAERKKLTLLEKHREEKINEYIEKYGSNSKKYEIKIQAEQSDTILKLDQAIESQKEIIKYLEEVCKIMSNFNFSIKNSVEIMKMM